MDKALILREMLQKKDILVVAGVYDALTARIAQYCGFSVLYMTGYGAAAAHGYPDFGLMTMTEMLESIRRTSDAVEVPVIGDADTGYGSPVNVYRTVREYERAGAAGIQIEDQTWPKRCGHMEGKQIIPAEEMVAKVKAAVDARLNPETVLVIRTDAIATQGLDEAIHRAGMYAEAGADVIFIEAPTPEQAAKIPAQISKPCLMNVALPDQDIGVETLAEMGYAIALFPAVTLLGTIEGCLKRCQSLLGNGRYLDPTSMPFNFNQLNTFLGLDEYRDLDNRYALDQNLKKG